MSLPEAHELLTSKLALIERAVAFACRRHRLDGGDAEDFHSIVMLRLVESDYAILRAFEERSSFTTYINIVVQRMMLDYRITAWGKWHASAEAKRLGDLAVELEKLLARDGRTLDDALAILSPKHEGVTRESLASVAARLPARAPRHREVTLEEAPEIAASNEVEEPLLADERRASSNRVSTLMSEMIARLPDDDRLILQLRFEGQMSVAQIARMLRIDQKLLYRRIEQRMRELKRELEQRGVARGDVLDLIGRDEPVLHFDFGNRNSRPSITSDGKTAHSEGSQ